MFSKSTRRNAKTNTKNATAKKSGKVKKAASKKRAPSWLSRLGAKLPAYTLSRRVATLVMLAVIGQGAVLALYVTSDNAQTRRDAMAKDVASLHAATNEVTRALASLRDIQVSQVRLRGEHALPAMDANVKIARRLITDLDKVSKERGIRTFGADRALSEVNELGVMLEAFAQRQSDLGVTATDGLKGELRATAAKIEAEMKAANITANPFQRAGLNNLTRSLLTMRVHEKDFMLLGMIGQVKQHATEVEAFKDTLKATGLPRQTESKIDIAADVYAKAFAEYVALADEQAQQSRALDLAFKTTTGRIQLAEQFMSTRAAELTVEAAESRDATRQLMLYTVAGTALLLLVLGAVLARSITAPLRQQAKAMRDLAQGDLDIAIYGQTRRSELGEMARSLVVFRDNLVETRKLRAAEDAHKAEAEQQRVEAMRRLAAELEASVSGVVESVSQTSEALRSTAVEMSGTIDNSGKRASIASTAATETNANVGTVAAAAEELSRSIDEIGERAQRSSDVVREAVRQAKAADDGVTSLAEAGVRISDVVALISDIAEQTNLLALNATIEASRAGEAGRGFTVVANEVKTLAGQTAKATQDISSRIKAMRDATEGATTAIQAISGTVSEVDEITHAIAAAVEEQGATTRSISQNIHHAAEGTRSVSEQMGEIDTGTQATKASAQNVLGAADTLSKQAKDLETRLEETLQRLRAA